MIDNNPLLDFWVLYLGCTLRVCRDFAGGVFLCGRPSHEAGVCRAAGGGCNLEGEWYRYRLPGRASLGPLYRPYIGRTIEGDG